MANEVSLEGMSQADLQNMAALQTKLLSDPRTRKQVLTAIKTLHPDFTAPELAADESTAALRAEFAQTLEGETKARKLLEDRIAAQDSAAAEARGRDAWNKIKMAPVEQGFITEAELPELETFMKAEGFNNTQYLQAARYRAAQKQLAPPTPAPIVAFKMPDKAELRNNPKKFFRENTLAAVNESNVRKATGAFGKTV